MSWAREAIIYNIYPIGFCNAPRENDFVQKYRLDNIYQWIPYYKELNVNTILFNPLFESTRHGYDTIDLKNVDKRLGDNESFKNICKELKNNGIRIMLDGVFNHVGRDFWAFKDVQKNLENSKYANWFSNLNFNNKSPYGDNFSYDGWAGNYDLVKLNLENPEVVDLLLDAVNFWIDEFDIDGLRLDAADRIDLNFFKQLKTFCNNKKSDFWLFGEVVHGDYNIWANKDTLDSVTNYQCYKGLYSSLNDHNYFEVGHELNRQFAKGGVYENLYLYSFVDNHDVNRIASEIKNPDHLYNVYTLMYCMPGVPSIYYGSEWGIKGKRTNSNDYDLRPSIKFEDIKYNSLLEHVKNLNSVRYSLDALKYGDYESVLIQNEQFVLKRQTENQTVYVAFNISNNTDKIGFNTIGNGILTDVLNNNEKFNVTSNYAEIAIPCNTGRVLVLTNE